MKAFKKSLTTSKLPLHYLATRKALLHTWQQVKAFKKSLTTSKLLLHYLATRKALLHYLATSKSFLKILTTSNAFLRHLATSKTFLHSHTIWQQARRSYVTLQQARLSLRIPHIEQCAVPLPGNAQAPKRSVWVAAWSCRCNCREREWMRVCMCV